MRLRKPVHVLQGERRHRRGPHSHPQHGGHGPARPEIPDSQLRRGDRARHHAPPVEGGAAGPLLRRERARDLPVHEEDHARQAADLAARRRLRGHGPPRGCRRSAPGDPENGRAVNTDILVIGDGLAGSAAAIEAARMGASVALVSAAHGSSDRAQGGIAAATLPEDSPRLHALDTLAAGGDLCDPSAVAMLTSAGPGTVRWLESLGVRFDGGSAREAAHSLPRVLHLGGDQSGSTLMGFMRTAIELEPRITRSRARLDSLIGDDSCSGAAFSGGLIVVAGATVLATGGYAGLYGRTTNSRISNGEGILEAARAGARVADLEFVQFHPTVFDGPESFLITGALRGAGAVLVDDAGARFVDELLPRDQVARAVAAHHGRAFLSAVHLDPDVLRHSFPNFIRNCRRVGIDPLIQPVPVAPAAHYTMGGIVTDLDGRSSLAGLYAAGECARTGVHGANRLASNSPLEAATFGRRAAA